MSFNQFFLVLKMNILEKANANKLHIFLCVCVVCFYWQWGWSGWIRHRGLIEFKEPLLTGHSQWCGGLLTSWCAFARVCVFGMDRCVFICRGLLCVLSQVRRVFFCANPIRFLAIDFTLHVIACNFCWCVCTAWWHISLRPCGSQYLGKSLI